MPCDIPGFDELRESLDDFTFPRAQDDLNNWVHTKRFMDVLYGSFGCETASLYVYEQSIGRLQHLADAFQHGLELPFCDLKKRSGAGPPFRVTLRNPAEVQRIRAKQRNNLRIPHEHTTSELYYDNFTRTKRRSLREAEQSWLLVPSGERALFSFEWSLVRHIENQDPVVPRRTLARYITTNLVKKIWQSIYASNRPDRKRMKGRGPRDIRAAVKWLTQVLSEHRKPERDHVYLWECRDDQKNWFIRKAYQVKKLLRQQGHAPRINYSFLKDLAHLIVTGSVIGQSDEPISLKSVRFFERSRVAPEMEFMIGSHTLVGFLLQFAPSGTGGAANPAHALLLGTFDDNGLWRENASHLRRLFHQLATRDFIRFISEGSETNSIEVLETKIRERESILKRVLTNPPNHVPKRRADASFLIARRYNSWYPAYFDVTGGCYALLLAADKADQSRCIVIDPGFSFLKPLLKLGVQVSDIDSVIVTHFHPDHVAGIFEYTALRHTIGKATTLWLNQTTHDALKCLGGPNMTVKPIKADHADDLALEYERADGKYEKVSFKPFTTYHREIGGIDSLGLEFTFETYTDPHSHDGFRTVRLAIVGDTSFEDQNIDLVKELDGCHVVVLHLGSMQKKRRHAKHLYLGGLERMLRFLDTRVEKNRGEGRGRLVLISELGLEHAEEAEFRRVTQHANGSSFQFGKSPFERIQSWASEHFHTGDVLVADIGLEVALKKEPKVTIGGEDYRAGQVEMFHDPGTGGLRYFVETDV